MKVNCQQDISFKSFYTNKALKRCLEFAADNGALFGASATVGFSLARPLSIMLTPKTEKENREIAAAKSITSSIIGFLLMLGFSVPLANAVKKIDKNPVQYINSKTIAGLKEMGKPLEASKGYIFATQLFKLGIGAVAAVPKAVATAFGMPYILKMFDKSNTQELQNQNDKNISFRAKPANKLASWLGKIMDKESFLKFTDRFKDTNFPLHIVALTDAITTGTFIYQTKQSRKIKDERKPALMYNSAISTGLCIAGGYALDKALEKPTEKFVENFRKANFGQKNLEKQIQGIKIAKPILILGTIYYILIPFISTFLAERADKNFDKGVSLR